MEGIGVANDAKYAIRSWCDFELTGTSVHLQERCRILHSCPELLLRDNLLWLPLLPAVVLCVSHIIWTAWAHAA